jgi:NTP pyrophosphatase (non-canonical NTP hydrolase)
VNFSEYMPLALRTAKPFPHDQQVKHALLGLITEIGELADNVKKFAIYGKPFDAVNMMEEVADCCWYLNLYMHEKHLGGKLVDDVWESAKDEFLRGKGPTTDPWDMVDAVLGLTAVTGSLFASEKDRGISDREMVGIISVALCSFLLYAGYTLSDALTKNIDKLALRYGDKYSDYHALNRDTGAERQVLEGGTS